MSLEFFGVDPRCTCEGVVSDALPHEQTVLLLKSRTLDPDPGILVEPGSGYIGGTWFRVV